MDLSINLLVTYLMHLLGMFYSVLEGIMGQSFDDLTTSEEGDESSEG